MEAIVKDVICAEDLLKFEKKYKEEEASGSLSKNTKFEYAWCLIRSKYPDDIGHGVNMLEALYHDGPAEEHRDYLFYLAVGNYRLKEYEKSLNFVKSLLKKEPGNTQARELERMISKKMQRDGLVGMAIVGGVVAGLAGLAAVAIGISKSKS
uniref:Mitochondrial fission 1 protein n=1 Tax=Eptatretus burgeri TaxID=7764 RepID=A0A8C4NCQ1_EPTBU